MVSKAARRAEKLNNLKDFIDYCTRVYCRFKIAKTDWVTPTEFDNALKAVYGAVVFILSGDSIDWEREKLWHE